MVFPAGDPHDHGSRIDVHDLGVEQIRQVGNIRQFLCGPHSDFNHCQFVADERRLVQIYNLDYINQPGQLQNCLVQGPLVFHGYDDVDTRHIRFFRIAGVNILNVDGSPADEAGYVRQHARFIIAQNSQMLFHHVDLPLYPSRFSYSFYYVNGNSRCVSQHEITITI